MGKFLRLLTAFVEEVLDGAASVLGFAHEARAAPVHHFHCTRCGQRFRYRERAAGGRAWCPRCLRPLRLPEPARP